MEMAWLRMYSFAWERVAASSVRKVPWIRTWSQTMLQAVPPWISPKESTALLSGEIVRLTKVWRFMTIEAAATTASRPRCGAEPWAVRPRTVILKLSQEAMRPPGSRLMSGASSVPQMCMPKIAPTPSRQPLST